MVIFVLALLVFGPKKLPEVSRQIGKGIREFRRASDQIQGELHGALNMDDDAEDDEDEDEASESRDTPTISANGHTAGSAAVLPEETDGAGHGDDAVGDGPASPERAD
jgi:TatA/E family protein of Tat protein translocase